jgi:hypothetical protein
VRAERAGGELHAGKLDHQPGRGQQQVLEALAAQRGARPRLANSTKLKMMNRPMMRPGT